MLLYRQSETLRRVSSRTQAGNGLLYRVHSWYHRKLNCSLRPLYRTFIVSHKNTQTNNPMQNGTTQTLETLIRPNTEGITGENAPLKNKPVGYDPADLSWDQGGKSKRKALSPLYSATRKLIDDNKGCVCLIQVGGFYELYFEQAAVLGPKLGIKVSTRKTLNMAVPMAGFPLNQLQKFVKILVHDFQMNVAIVDQFEHVPSDTDLKHRKISRIVSPGTLVDESFMNYSQNNYLVALSPKFTPSMFPDPDLPVGILCVDISVGEFYVQQTTLGELAGDLRRISPSEVILPKELQALEPARDHFLELADLRKYFVRYHKTIYNDFKVQLQDDILSTRKLLEDFSVREEAAMNLVLSYVHVNLPDRKLVLEQPSRYLNTNYLAMDSRTRDALELTGRSTFGSISVVGLLLHTIKRTKTASGSRLLSKWILSPILDAQQLDHRFDFVDLFKENVLLANETSAQLGFIGDSVRLLQKLALNSGPPVTHLQNIASGLVQLEQLRKLMERASKSLGAKEAALLERFVQGFVLPPGVAEKITETIQTEDTIMFSTDSEETSDEFAETEPPVDPENTPLTHSAESSVTFSINKTHNEELSALHSELQNFREQESMILANIEKLAKSIDTKASVAHREQSGRHYDAIFVKCRAKYLPEIAARLAADIKADIREKCKNHIVAKTANWIDTVEQKKHVTQTILTLEKAIIDGLRLEVLAHISTIRAASRCADFLDVTASFGALARENSWVRPKLVNKKVLSVSEGRHAVVEASLKQNGKSFVANDTQLGSDGGMWVISGPNMGGKSTFLRQNALIVILAQIGCFVPARKATLSIVDRMFTRVGASDDLFSDLSTFMVEMIETSNILKNATSRSLAIVDEIGRGTSRKEGLAIAYAALVHLLKVNKCRTLFATHFGADLKELLNKSGIDQDKIRFYKTQVVKSADGKHTFQHVLESGISEKSYALEVAELAGFPKPALKHAERALVLV